MTAGEAADIIFNTVVERYIDGTLDVAGADDAEVGEGDSQAWEQDHAKAVWGVYLDVPNHGKYILVDELTVEYCRGVCDYYGERLSVVWTCPEAPVVEMPKISYYREREMV